MHQKCRESMASFAYNLNGLRNAFKNRINFLCFRYLSFNSIQAKPKLEVMPKDNSVLLQKLRENRLNNAKKSADNKMASNDFQISVLGNGSRGNPKAIYVTTDRSSYLFNCGEGTQRLATEHKYVLTPTLILINF